MHSRALSKEAESVVNLKQSYFAGTQRRRRTETTEYYREKDKGGGWHASREGDDQSPGWQIFTACRQLPLPLI